MVSLVDAWLHYSKAVEIRQLAGLDFSNLTVLNLLVLLFDSMDSAMRNKMNLWQRLPFYLLAYPIARLVITDVVNADGGRNRLRFQPCNVDATSSGVDQLTSFAAVVRDSNGVFVKGLTGHHRANMEPKLVEAFAIREALSWLEALRMDGVMVESDYLQVISALKQVDKDVYDFALRLLDAKARVAHLFTRVALSYASYS
ncbi:hypothetical protein Gohar_021252 [Gossypium harknessii]|uniref:RNase H type-1 domain-containing protein n=1 Tax=Gossypium harknessii TaxID=34285 RepID=A0A7J9IBG9_9ROSI|nr:hypothetical protein [Gossypium harknessii]